MATAKKTIKAPAKKAPAKAVKRPVEPSKREERTFAMPQEVKEWIERANSTIQHLRGKVARLETENKELKAYQKFAEHRILRSEHE